ncbi:DEKNAAC102712 [Brettanomyces naardenensis]|uniref:DEKNAAC102712 n=1 Tax=Brettanomyces naardenensis TaxID=13370 RepID=A0A448YL72_BRENA|nr:DEKNAAC102712 [Brettanomyces naardenensis]
MTSLSSSVSSVASRSEIPESRASTEEAQSGASSFSRSSTAFPPGYVPEIALTTPFSYSSVKAPYITPQMRQHAEQLRRQALEADDTKKPKIDERGVGATPSASMSRTNSSVKFLNFTRKAARIAGDIAFGTSVYTNSYADERKIETLKARRQEKLTEDRSQQVEELRKKLVEAGKEKYLDNLRFFLKYMDDSEFNDPLAYAITRRDMWLLWYRKYLLKLKERIALYESLVSERRLLLSKKASPKQSQRLSSSLPPLPSVAIVRKGMFQDRRVLLSLLWYLQIFKKLVHQPAILKGIFKNMANVADAEEDPSSVQTTPEVCILTTNKLGTSGEAVAMAAPYLPENSIAAANIEFIDGWHLRHETEHTHVNVVTVADKLQTLTDIQGKGYLTPEVELENPQFNSAPLDNDFYQYQLGEREKEFMRNYSSFTTTGVSQIPLRDSSQSCIVAEDLTSCVDDPDSLAETLEEFARVLKPDGSIYLQLWDIDPCSQVPQQQAESRIRNSYEFVRYRMWQKISAYSEKRSLALPDITRRIVPALRRAGFKHVRTTFVGYPLLSTTSVELDTSITESLDDNPAATEADGEIDANSFTEPGAPDSAPVIGSVSQERIESQSSASTIRSSVKGSKDARINSFFEVLSSFTEFLTAVKALRLHELSSDLAICENIAGLRKKAEEGIDTEAEIDTLLRSMKEVNREQLNMVKLFVDYKLNGVEAPLVKTEILQGTKYGERAYLCSHEETIDGESRYEGLGYMMVVVAERI